MQDQPQLLQVRHRQGGEPEALAELPGRDTGGHLRGQRSSLLRGPAGQGPSQGGDENFNVFKNI